MSKTKTIKTIQNEINNLNCIIDLKIIKGLSFRAESIRHRFLIKQLDELNRDTDISFVKQATEMLNMFMF